MRFFFKNSNPKKTATRRAQRGGHWPFAKGPNIWDLPKYLGKGGRPQAQLTTTKGKHPTTELRKKKMPQQFWQMTICPKTTAKPPLNQCLLGASIFPITQGAPGPTCPKMLGRGWGTHELKGGFPEMREHFFRNPGFSVMPGSGRGIQPPAKGIGAFLAALG